MISQANGEIRFVQKPDREVGEVAVYRRWRSRCGRFRVVHVRFLYGPQRGPGAIPQQYRAERLDGGCWRVISRHRKRGPAFRACRKWTDAQLELAE